MEEKPLKHTLLDKERYQWVIYVLCFAISFLTLGFCGNNSGLYLTAVTKALDISRSTYSLRNVFRYATATVLSLFFGPFISRFGEKKLTCFGIVSLIFAVLTAAWAESALLIFVSGILLGLGFNFCATTMITYIIGRWCTKNRGLITGVVLSATGLGGAVAAQIVTPMIYDETDLFGYRRAYYMIAVMLVVLLVLVIAFLREPPRSEGETFERRKKRASAASWSGVTFQEVARKPFFYLTLAVIFFSTLTAAMTSLNLSPLMTDKGIDSGFIATALSVQSLALLLSKAVSGGLSDRFGLRKIMALCQTCLIVSLASMLVVSDSTFGRGMALLSNMTAGLGMAVETVLVSCTVIELFGDRDYAKIMGICMAACTAGIAVGNFAGNLVFDLCGSYDPMLWTMAIVMVVVTVMFQFCMTSARKMRKEIETKAVD